MNVTATVKLYSGPHSDYELIWCEEKSAWYIRSTDRRTEEQAYSAEGWDDKPSAARAFDTSQITYVEQPPWSVA